MTEMPPGQKQAHEQRQLLDQAREIKRLRAALAAAEAGLSARAASLEKNRLIRRVYRDRLARFYALACRLPVLGAVFPPLRRAAGRLLRALRRGR